MYGAPHERVVYPSALLFSVVFAAFAAHRKLTTVLRRWADVLCVSLWLVFTVHLLVLVRMRRNEAEQQQSPRHCASCLVMMFATVSSYTLLPWRCWRYAGVASALANVCHVIAVFYPIATYSADDKSFKLQWSAAQVRAHAPWHTRSAHR